MLCTQKVNFRTELRRETFGRGCTLLQEISQGFELAKTRKRRRIGRARSSRLKECV